jgi:competence protein ComEC
VIVALAIGDQRAVTEAQWQVFNRTGVGHLISISGLHVTVFAAFAGGIAFALARRSVRLTSRLPARKSAAVVGATAAFGYVLLAGAEIPAMRTFAMLAVGAYGVWLGRPGTAGIIWLWALAVVLVWDPWAPLTPGFWLSFGAVAILLYAGVGRLREVRGETMRVRLAHTLRESAQAQWVITLGLTPLTLALFQQMSLIAPLANAVSIPVVTLAVVPLALAGIFVPIDGFFQLAHAVLSPLMRVLETLATLPDAAWQQHAPPLWTVVAGLAGTLWMLAPRAVPGRIWGLLWMLPLFIVRPAPLPEGAFRMTVLDVGQGLAVTIETRRYTLVYDTGARYTETTDAGGRIVAPFLRAIGRPRADGLVISHQDVDHAGGALSLMQTVPVGWLASSLYANHPIVLHVTKNRPVMACIAGQAWAWDGVVFTVLHPTAAEYDDAYAKTNDRSCVVRVDSAYGSALLTGDIEAKSESLLLARDPAALRADIVVVPHHGSRTSSTLPFVRAVGAMFAVVACGYANRFGHPRRDVIARYTGEGASVWRTDEWGAVAFTFSADQALAPRLARVERQRYWLDRPTPTAVRFSSE